MHLIVDISLLVVKCAFRIRFNAVKMFWVEESVSFIEGDGVFVLILGILALLIIFIDFPTIFFFQNNGNI